MPRRKNGEEIDQADLQTGFAVGYVYHRIKQELDTIGTTTGGKITPHDAAAWVGKLLLAEARRGLLDGRQPLPEVRRDSTDVHEKRAATEKVHVHARDQRTLVRSKSSRVTCRLCGKSSKNRRLYMLHRNSAHPEAVATQIAAIRLAKKSGSA